MAENEMYFQLGNLSHVQDVRSTLIRHRGLICLFLEDIFTARLASKSELPYGMRTEYTRVNQNKMKQ